ncbi:MAG: endonuclease VII domain-containing protein [Solirubrobacterales bacterium]
MCPTDSEGVAITTPRSKTAEYRREYDRKRYAEKREQILEQQRARVASRTPDQREERLEYNRDWYRRNRNQERTKQADRRASLSPGQQEQRREQRHTYYIENRERIIAEVRAYGNRNPTAKREARLKQKYGIDIPEYERLLVQQHGRCAICGIAADDARSRLRVDHDHDTGAVRGLLCDNCNIGLGHFADNAERMAAAIAYLQRHAR